MAKTSHNIKEWSQLGFEDFIAKTEIAAPHTEIVDRAKVKSGLSTSMGVERIHTTSINLLNKESGPNGEPVYEADNKDSRIRFVGAEWEKFNDSNASRLLLRNGTTNFFEVSFYGTGLNVLSFPTTSDDFKVSVDGGAESDLDFLNQAGSVLNGRSYKVNNIFTLTSGLSLGWHTVKVRRVTGDLNVFGFEIINESTQIAFEAGSAFSGTSKESLKTLAYSDYNAGISGTKGARVVKYLLNNEIGQAVQEVDVTAQYLSNTDHSNEEEVKRYNWREFGANRSDDFSTVSGTGDTDRAFTLDDGTTTLVGNNISGSLVGGTNEFLRFGLAGSYITLTFIGTGLDIVKYDDNTPGDTYEVFVDGTSQGSIGSTGVTDYRTETLCSGLPYGTHTVRINRNTAAGHRLQISDFIVYQPKTPEIPSGAVELAKYNVMADFVADTNSGIQPSQGVLAKSALRENTYVGTWSTVGGVDPQFRNGFNIDTVTNNDYVEYSFFGTGIEHIFYSSNGSGTVFDYTIDGASDLSGFTTSFVHDAPGAVSFDDSTGRLSGGAVTTSQYGARLSISGLSLGWHTLRVTMTGGEMWVDAFDIITPIYEPVKNVGSNSLKANTNDRPIIKEDTKSSLGEAKALLMYSQTSNEIFSSLNVEQIVDVTTGVFYVYFKRGFKNKYYAMSGSANDSIVPMVAAESTAPKTPKRQAVVTRSTNNSVFDTEYVCLVWFGELEDESEE